MVTDSVGVVVIVVVVAVVVIAVRSLFVVSVVIVAVIAAVVDITPIIEIKLSGPAEPWAKAFFRVRRLPRVPKSNPRSGAETSRILQSYD